MTVLSASVPRSLCVAVCHVHRVLPLSMVTVLSAVVIYGRSVSRLMSTVIPGLRGSGLWMLHQLVLVSINSCLFVVVCGCPSFIVM